MLFKKAVSIVLMLMLSVTFQSFDCESEDFIDSCSAQIAGYKFLKANRVNIGMTGGRRRAPRGGGGDATEVNVKQVFSKGTTYKITACSGIDKGLEVTLMDRSGRKRLLSNYSRKKKKYYPSITYKCQATGVYYLNYKFEDDAEQGCGLSIIGFKK